MKPSKSGLLWQLITIISFSCLPYLFTLDGEFVFDDSEAIVKNEDVVGESYKQLFYNDFWGTNIKSNLSHKSYRPLTILSFRLNYLLSGKVLVALHFKITNLICHTLCSILVWLTYNKILETASLKNQCLDSGFLAALLFSSHPIHVESISGIVGRADILAAITFFITFLVYNKALMSTNKLYEFIYLLLVSILAGLAMLFKENGVTVLGFCALYECVIKFKMKKSTKFMYIISHESVFRIAYLVFASLLLIYLRWNIMGGTKPEFKPIDNPAAFSNSTFTKLATYNYIYFLNALLLIWPHWLCFDWSMGCVQLIEDLRDIRIVFILLLYVYIALAVRMTIFKRNGGFARQILIGFLLTAIPFLPASNIFFPVGFVIAERVLYIPSAGYCFIIAIGLNKIIQRTKLRKFGIALFVLLLLVFTLKTWRRSLEWRNEYLLFTSGLSVCPLNAKVHYNVAKVADAKHYTDWALQEYREAIRLNPEYYQAMNNLANLLKNEKQYAEAEILLRKALELKSDFPAAWMNFGIILSNTKRYKESFNAYKMALKYRKNYPDCYYNLGNLYLELNETQKAMDSWLDAIHLKPTHNLAWTNLLALLDNTGQLEKALELVPKALAAQPLSPSVNFAIANIYGKLNRYEDAESHFKYAIHLFGDQIQPIHYANLGVLYHRWKRYNLAQDMYKNALKLDPKFVSAQRNLKSLQKYLNK